MGGYADTLGNKVTARERKVRRLSSIENMSDAKKLIASSRVGTFRAVYLSPPSLDSRLAALYSSAFMI